jgi:hypothetical protein
MFGRSDAVLLRPTSFQKPRVSVSRFSDLEELAASQRFGSA